LACFLLSASPTWAQAKSSIEKLNAEWMAAFNKGDGKALAAMYTPDAYGLPTGAEVAKGHNAIEKFWGGAVKQLGDAKLTTVDVQSLGPGAAREIGTFSFKTKAQTTEQMTGKYFVGWRKLGGRRAGSCLAVGIADPASPPLPAIHQSAAGAPSRRCRFAAEGPGAGRHRFLCRARKQ